MGPRAAALAAALAASLQAPAASCPDPDKGGHLTLNASTWTLPCPPRASILSALHLWGGHCPLPCRSLMCTPNQPTPPAPPPGCTPNLSISCSPALSQHRLPPCTGEPGRGTGHMTSSHQGTSRGRPGGVARPPPSALACSVGCSQLRACVLSRWLQLRPWTPAYLPTSVTAPGLLLSLPCPGALPQSRPGASADSSELLSQPCHPTGPVTLCHLLHSNSRSPKVPYSLPCVRV